MKVLWFTNTPCGAASKIGLGTQFGGWLTSLESELSEKPEIELHVSFYSEHPIGEFKINNVTYHPIKRALPITGKLVRKFDGGVRAERGELSRILEVINRVKPEIIHVHGTEDNFGLIQTKTDRPVIISIQGIINPYLIQYFSGIPLYWAFRKFPFQAIRSKLFGFKVMEKQAKRERRILLLAKTVLGRTDWDKRVTSVLAPMGAYRHSDEILRPTFYNTDWQFQNRRQIKLISIQSGGFYKGFETILKAAQHLKNQCGVDFTWDVIGIDHKSRYVEICETVTDVRANDVGIQLLGIRDEATVAKLVSDSDIFVHASHVENSPNSVCEAMLIGIPIIASSSGGTSSLITDGTTGVLYQAGDYFGLSGAILEMSKSPDRMGSIGKAGKEVAKIRHHPGRIAEELIGIYREVANPSTTHL